jgi:hypothetical protein
VDVLLITGTVLCRTVILFTVSNSISDTGDHQFNGKSIYSEPGISSCRNSVSERHYDLEQYVRSTTMNLLKTASRIGMIYFIIFSAFYIIQFIRAWRLLVKYFNTDFAHDLMARTITDSYTIGTTPGTTVFAITAILAILGAIVWFYQFKWGEQSATVS